MSSPGSLPATFGRYQVLEELGTGAMGVVYLCVDQRLNRPVAIKVMRESEFMTATEREQYQARFRHEAEAAGRLNHPDIVQVYDVGPSWMVMEFLEGQALNVLLRSGERLSVGRVVELVTRVADAVDYAHRHGIVHRDIKPANIMLLDDGGVKVMDFGVARLEHSTLTALGTVVGSVRYMAPEQMMGERVDGRADVFSVAAVAYELLTGRAPFPGKTITEVVSRVVHGAHVPPQKADDRLPAALDAVFARAFAPKPAERYPRSLEFARDLAVAAAPALDLEVTRGPEVTAGRTEVPARTTTPNPTLPAPPSPALEDTVLLDPTRNQGRLLLEMEPPGAQVELDGCPVVPSEEGTRVPWGRHRLRVFASEHEEARADFEVSAGHPVVRVSVSLPPKGKGGTPSAGFLTLEADVMPPRRTEGALPTCPATLPGGRASAGSASVDVYVGESGEVVRVDEVEGAPEVAGRLAEAVRRWRFAPATRGGRPVAVRLRVQHIFVA